MTNSLERLRNTHTRVNSIVGILHDEEKNLSTLVICLFPIDWTGSFILKIYLYVMLEGSDWLELNKDFWDGGSLFVNIFL